MGFAWLLRENLRTSHGTSTAISVSNDIVLGSIVADATNQVSAVREVFLADDDDASLLNGTPHHPELSAAANAKGLPYPGRQGISFVNYGVGCPAYTTPTLSAPATTWLPGTLPVRLSNLATGVLPVMVIGTQRMLVDLTPIGLPGCMQLVRSDACVVLPAPVNGTTTLLMAVPLSSSLTGARLDFQGIALIAGGSGSNWAALSNAGEATVARM